MFTIPLITTALAVPSGQTVSRIRPMTGTSYGIIHANATDIKDHPYMVSIYSRSYDALIGSGAILNHYWILVTAYEVEGLEAGDLTVRAGSNFGDRDGQEFNVSKIIVNQYFNSQYWSDIALLKTATIIVFSDTTKRIGLAYYKPGANTTAVISGFGENEEDCGVLRSTAVTILSNSVCKQYLDDPNEGWLCAVPNTSVQAAFDDFGNPLVQKNVLVGNYLGTIEDGPDIFISIYHWKRWIIENIKRYNK